MTRVAVLQNSRGWCLLNKNGNTRSRTRGARRGALVSAPERPCQPRVCRLWPSCRGSKCGRRLWPSCRGSKCDRRLAVLPAVKVRQPTAATLSLSLSVRSCAGPAPCLQGRSALPTAPQLRLQLLTRPPAPGAQYIRLFRALSGQRLERLLGLSHWAIRVIGSHEPGEDGRARVPWAEQVKHRAGPTITNKIYRYPQAL
jgi:hypothetical protein